MDSKHLLIVYYSQSGNTEAMARAVIAGARHKEIEQVDVRVRSALEADAEDVQWCDGLILGSPENFGYMSGALKYFFDRIYYPCLENTQGRPYSLFIRAGNDGSGALGSIRRIVTGLQWREIQEPVVIAGDFDKRALESCEELGMSMAAGLEAGIY